MLFTQDKQRVTEIPHPREYRVWRARLTDAEYDGLIAAVTKRIDTGVDLGASRITIGAPHIITSSWIPGHDWTGTPYQVIYEKACLEDENQAALFFGLVVWHAVMLHPESWSFGKYHQNDILGTTYFRVEV